MCKRLLEETDAHIVGFDNMSDYYDVGIKEDRLRMLKETDGGAESSSSRFTFVKGDLADAVNAVFEHYQPSIVVNLAVAGRCALLMALWGAPTWRILSSRTEL